MTDKKDPGRESPFLTREEAADFLRVEPRTLDNWRSTGTGPAFRKHGGRVVYHVSALEQYSEGRSFSYGQ
jgi:predicted site-specific integrase-resolvase